MLTIMGRQLGRSYDDRRDNVFVKMSNSEVKCVVNETETFDPSLIVCKMEKPFGTGAGRVNITFASGRNVSSPQLFNFYVSLMYPCQELCPLLASGEDNSLFSM